MGQVHQLSGIVETQSVWGMYIVWYLFLAGVGAGAYTAGYAFDILGSKFRSASKVGVALAAPLVLVGTVLLILDLGQPANVVSLYLTPNPTSMIALGTIIITIFMIIGAVHIGLFVWPSKSLETHGKARRVIGGIGLAFALATAVYTGVLLGVVKSVPFWNNSLLPMIFLVSALSTGIGSVVAGQVVVRRGKTGEELASIAESIQLMAKADMALIAAEILAVFFYLTTIPGSSPEAGASVNVLTTGDLSVMFWGGLIFAGLAFPLALESGGHFHSKASEAAMGVILLVSGLCVLAGGVLLRYLILAAGVPVG